MNASTSKLALVAANLGNDLIALRSTAVTTENKGNTAARSMLASLVSGVMTESLIVAAVLHSFGNPKLASGKPLEKLTGSGDIFVGFGAVRKMAAKCFKLFADIDADAITVEHDGETVGAAIRPLIVAFILNEQGAPKGLTALEKAVSKAIRAYVKATQPDNAEATADNDAEADADAPVAQSLTDRTLSLMVAYEASSDDEKSAAHDALSALFDMVNASIEAADAQPEAIAA